MSTAILDITEKNLIKLKDILLKKEKDYEFIINKEVTELLLDNGFIVDSNFDEIKWLQCLHNKSRGENNALSVGIVLTYSCNFRCTYCYEKHINIDMKKNILDAVYNFVINNSKKKKNILIDWFGGEPLLNIKQIQLISYKLIKYCKDKDILYRSRISTNGYLLNKENANILKECCVNETQITLDGPPELHDKRRFLTNKNGTFNIIYKNLLEIKKIIPKILVRINIDKRNKDSIFLLLEKYLINLKENITISFSYTNSPCKTSIKEKWMLTSNEYLQKEKELGIFADKFGFKVLRGYPYPCTSFCSAYLKNSFLVDPNGYLHRCSKFLGNEVNRYGKINDNGEIIFNDGIQKKWDNWSPFDDVECKKCEVLPLCMGGCLLNSTKPKKDNIRCFAKYDLLNSLLRESLFNEFKPNNKKKGVMYAR
ncbi:MAG: radical SAM protein [Ignavibacteria bacterium]|jgi:uncharacterized protein